MLAELIDVDKGVSRLRGGSLATKSFAENDVLDFQTHIDITETPPAVLLAIIDEAVVVSALSRSIVDQDCMQIIRHITIVREGGTLLLHHLLDLMLDDSLFPFNHRLVGGEQVYGSL